MKIFISHASANKVYGNALVDLLLGIGVKDNEIIFTSNPAYGIPIGQNIFNWLKSRIQENSFVIYLLSNEYYKSIACLNEMGAAWVIENEHAAIFLPDFEIESFEFQNGVIDPRRIGFKVNEKDRVLQFCLNLREKFKITDNLLHLTQRVEAFTATVSSIAGQLVVKEGETGSHQSAKLNKTYLTQKHLEYLKTKYSKTVAASDRSIIFEKLIGDIDKGKLDDTELLLLKYMLDNAKLNLKIGWQMADEVNLIEEWEEFHNISSVLSKDYEKTTRRLKMRGYLEPSAWTAGGNEKEVQLTPALSPHMLELPESALKALERPISNYPREDEEDQLPF